MYLLVEWIGRLLIISFIKVVIVVQREVIREKIIINPRSFFDFALIL